MDDLKRQIQAFYNELHEKRERQPPNWMEDEYWRFFHGRTLEIGPGILYPPGSYREGYVVAEYSVYACQRAHTEGISIVNADGEMLPFKDRSFDVVACHDVLEHVPQPDALLDEMCRVSRHTILVVGPNFVGGGRKRHGRLEPLAWRFLKATLGFHRKVVRFDKPHLKFDEQWESDADAVTGANAWYVVHHLKRNGFRNVCFHTFGQGNRRNRIPIYKWIGYMMFVIARRESMN